MSGGTPFWRRYLRFWGADPGADVEDEIRFHIEMRVDDLVARGLTPDQAQARVIEGFGDLNQVKRTCRRLAQERENAVRRTEWLSGWWEDVRYAGRQLINSAMLSAVLVLTLALGIGATVSIFSVLYAVVLRPLPYADSERIVAIFETQRTTRGSASAGHFHDWTEQSTTFEATAATVAATYNLEDGSTSADALRATADVERVNGLRATASLFGVAHVPPALGRYFTTQEAQAGARVAVLAHGLWQRRFAGEPSIVGREIRLNGESHRVVGIAPAIYSLTPISPQLWTPLTFSPAQRDNYGSHTYRVLAKLAPGVTRDQAQEDLERVTRGITARFPEEMASRGVNVEPYTDVVVGGLRTRSYVSFATAAFVLLIGCANVASLLLARAIARRKEIAVRSALGGGTWRIVRQLLTESLVLSVVGGAAGMGVAYVGVGVLVRAVPTSLPRLDDAGLNAPVLAFALMLTLLTGIAVGIVPACRATGADLREVLSDGGKGSLRGGRDRLRGALIVAEIAVAVMLLVGAGLFVRSAQRLEAVPLGFNTGRLLTARLALPAARYQDANAVADAYRRILEHARAIPGLERVGASTNIPLGGGSVDAGLEIEGKTFPQRAMPFAHIRLVTDGFLETAGIPLRRGRLLHTSDMGAGAPRVVVINEQLANAAWPGENPIGKRLSGDAAGDEPEWREVIGVVASTRTFGHDEEVAPEMYLPYTQAPAGAWNYLQRSMALVAQTAADPVSYASLLRGAVTSVDPSLPLYDVRSMESAVAAALAPSRFSAHMLVLLAAIGLALAAVGIYAVIAYFVAQRTAEIGLRLALGASPGSVLALVLRHGCILAVSGVAIGIGGALAATRVLATLLFDVSPTDPASYVIGALCLLGLALLACLIPATRAARLDPVRALAQS